MTDIIDLKSLQQEVTSLRASGNYKETIEACYILLDHGTKINDYKSILTAHINLAASFYLIGDTEEAYMSIENYDRVCRQHGDEEDYIYLYNILVILCEYNKNYNKAKNTINKSIELGLKYKKYNIVSNGYSNYSYLCLMEEDYQLALEKAKQAMEMASLHFPPNPILEFGIKLNIAKALIGLGDIESSRIMIKKMIEDSILDSHVREKAQCYELQGYLYAKQKQYRDAFDSYTIAKELIESYKDLHLLRNIQEERCKLCELMNDIHLGYKVQKEYISVLNEINERELSIAAVKFEIKQNYFAMEQKAITDYLTGLYNREYIETKVNDLIKNVRDKTESIVCIVFDIDNFKSINDNYGHLFGDEVIKKVSNACANILNKEDLFGRYGGDEFILILQGKASEKGKNIAEKIKTTLKNLEIFIDDTRIPIQASIGIADSSKESVLTFNELFHLADLALYQAKQNGKNQICIEEI